MALVLADRVKDTTTSTGTGTITLANSPPAGFQSFTAVGNGNTTYYTIAGGSQWEVGVGTYTASGTTLSRDTVLSSSSGGSLVDFAAGTKDVFVTYPAERSVYEDATGSININITGNAATASNATSAIIATNIAGGASGSIPYQTGANATTFLASGTGVLIGGAAPSYTMSPSLTQVTVAGNPTLALQVATKQYVDALIASGIHFHAPVRVESPINLNATYNNGTAGVGATLTNAGTQVALVIDGVTVSAADRVLIYSQTTQTQNGIYVVTDVGSGATNWVLTRASDADTYVINSAAGLSEGSTVFVQQGATGAGETYTCNTSGTITFGTTNITFVQISTAQIYSAGAGLTLTGTQFSLTTPVTAALGGTGLTSPGTNGNVLVSNGTAWTSAAMAAGIKFTDVKTSNYTAAVNDGVQTNTTAGSFTVTLPATPATGAQVIITDAGNTWGTNNLTVGRNGSTIEGVASDLICNISSVAVQLVYSGTTWTVFAQAGGAGGVIDINSQTTGTLTVSRGGTGATTLTGVVKGTGTSALTAGTVALGSEVSGTLPVGNGGTGATTLTANNVLLGNGTSAVQVVAPGTTGNVLTSNGTTWTSAAAPSSVVQYPQNSQSADYTLVIGDAGKQIFHPASDVANRTYTIPSDASVAFPIGTVVLFTVENGGSFVTVAISSDTLVSGTGVTGSIVVPVNNTLMCIKVTATKWMANYLFQNNPLASQVLAIAHNTTPFISAYPWSNTGFGVKFTNPATLPVGQARGVAFTSSGNAIAVTHDTTPFVSVYPWNGAGFGVKYANPATLPSANGYGVTFTSSGNAIAVAHAGGAAISAYPWSSSGFGTKFADPATTPTGTGYGVAFNSAGTAIAVAHATSPRISAYPWSGAGFGVKYANPATLPTGDCFGVAFNPSGNAIAVAHSTSPFVSAYPFSAGFGVKYANPATLPAGAGLSVAFNPLGTNIAVGSTTAPILNVYLFSSGFSTRFTDPTIQGGANGNGVAFSSTGDAIAVAHTQTPFISAYQWNAGYGFGLKFANPTTLPTGTGNAVAFTVSA